MNDPDIEIVVNLTYPLSHYEITKRALEAGEETLFLENDNAGF